MDTAFRLELVLILAYLGSSQYSTLVINVVELSSISNYTFVYNVSPSTNLTRWTYLVESTVTSLMTYQNGKCTVSPSGKFLGDGRYSYTCNSTAHSVSLHLTGPNDGLNNRIISCRDAVQPDETGSTWMIKIKDNLCSYCEPTMTFVVKYISEGDNVTFLCVVSSDVPYVNWNRNIGSNTVPMGVQNETCTTQGNATFLDDTSKYIFTCNDTVYQVKRLNVQRSEHNDMYMCTPHSQTDGKGSNWIIKVVKAQVTSVTITPPGYLVNVTENTPIEFTCTTSTARPAATIYWYRHPNGQDSQETPITSNITTTTDYNDLSVTTSKLRLFVTRQDSNTKVFCRANNAANTTKLSSTSKRLLNVLYAPRVAGEMNTNITSAKNALKTITVNVIAYPPPTFTWSQLMNGLWTPLDKNNKFIIKSSDVQSNLTILRVGMDDFTKYQVIVKNKVGLMEQNFTLSPYDIPDTPTELKHIQSQTTTTSIHIEWRPGYNGGPTQTFYIKYKKSSDSTWTYFTVIDNGKETMDISLTGLVEKTQYDIVIFSSNIIGNSSESQVLVASTEATSTNLGPLIGGIAGGVTVCIIIVIVIIVIIRRYKCSDGLVDNPMYISSSPVACQSSPSADDKAEFVKPNSNDLYAQVQKTKKTDAAVNGYEIFDVNTDNNKKTDMKKTPKVKATTNKSKMSNINQDGLNYADLVFKGSQPAEKKDMQVYEPTPYDLVDFTKKAEPLPDSDDDDNK